MKAYVRPAYSLVAITVALVSSVIVLPQLTHADTITVSPPKFELFGNPGDTINEKVKVSNDGTADATYETKVEDFQAAGDEGGIEINEDPNAPRTNFSLQRWITLEPSSFTVPAGQSKQLSMTIKIPKSGEPGGHYATIQVKIAGQTQVSGGASVESRLNTLVLLRVSGNITEQLKLDSFAPNQNYYQQGPVTFNLKTSNAGNVHSAPTGTIIITDMFGRKVKELPLNVANVLPGGSRISRTVWEDKGPIGRFTAQLVADYGQGEKQHITATTTFIIFPPFLAWILIGIVVILLLLVTQRKRFKRFINKLTSD